LGAGCWRIVAGEVAVEFVAELVYFVGPVGPRCLGLGVVGLQDEDDDLLKG